MSNKLKKETKMINTINTVVQGTYTQVNTDDIVALVGQQLKAQGLNYHYQASDKGKIDRWVLPDIKIHDGDSVMLGQIFLRNSMIPGTALNMLIGAYRIICANGLVIGVGEGGRVIHRTGEKLNNFVDNIPLMISRGLITLADDLQSTVDENRSIAVADPLGLILSLPIQKTVKEKIVSNICWGRATENIKDVWGLYNYVNEITRKHTKKVDTALLKDIGLLDHIKLLNQYGTNIAA